jgi:hypothetical protein
MTFRDGSVFTGSFVNGKRQGHGLLRMPSGAEREGMWVNNQQQGPGRMRAANGSEYRGEFLANLPNGQGSYTYPNGSVATGSWVAGKLRGPGEISWPAGLLFRGSFMDGVKHGPGIECNLRTGVCHEQHWENGTLKRKFKLERQQVPADIVARFGPPALVGGVGAGVAGQGGAAAAAGVAAAAAVAVGGSSPIPNLPTILVQNMRMPVSAAAPYERTYTGPVLKASPTVPHGLNGTLVAPTFTYQGGFNKARFHGPGRTTMPNGSVREGVYFESKLNGPGRFVNTTSGSVYEGLFVASVPEGAGVMKLKDGTVVEATYRAGLAEGFGTITSPSFNYAGELVGGKPTGHGRMKWPQLEMEFVGTFKNGVRDRGTMWRNAADAKIPLYQGSFLAGKAEGLGKAITRSGWIYEGSWKVHTTLTITPSPHCLQPRTTCSLTHTPSLTSTWMLCLGCCCFLSSLLFCVFLTLSL